MKKIIIIGPAYPLRGGLASFNERLARAFQEAGDDVELHTFSSLSKDFLLKNLRKKYQLVRNIHILR